MINGYRIIVKTPSSKSKHYSGHFVYIISELNSDTVFTYNDYIIDTIVNHVEGDLYSLGYYTGGTCHECTADMLLLLKKNKFKKIGDFQDAKDLNGDGKKEYLIINEVWCDFLSHAAIPDYNCIFILNKSYEFIESYTLEILYYKSKLNNVISKLFNTTKKELLEKDYADIMLMTYHCKKHNLFWQLEKIKSLIKSKRLSFRSNERVNGFQETLDDMEKINVESISFSSN